MNMLNKMIINLQNDYKKILEVAQTHFERNSSFAIIDEIKIFWKQKEKTVEFILKNISDEKYDTILYTAATFFDFDDYEHYPFITLGKKHIFDDPIASYVLVLETENVKFNETIKEKIVDGIKNNIKIIDQLCPQIILLPVRHLYHGDSKLLMEKTNECFLSIFNDIYNINDYFKKVISVDDIAKYLNYEAAEFISLDINENRSKNIIERFEELLSTDKILFKGNDGAKFYFLLFGHTAQIIDIISIIKTFGFIPFFRYEVAFNNMINLSSNFMDSDDMRILISMSVAHYFIYRNLDIETVSKKPFIEYINILEKSKFHEKVLSDVIKTMLLPNLNFKKISEYFSEKLKELYK